jgi:hypothetical protein
MYTIPGVNDDGSDTITEFLVLAVPHLSTLVANATAADLAGYLNAENHLTANGLDGQITTIDVNPINWDGGSVRLSLGEMGCKETNGGVYCDEELPIEYTEPIAFISDPSHSVFKAAVESLRSINKVVVTKNSLSQQVDDNLGYVIDGAIYDITFIKSSYFSKGTLVTDLNPFTWNTGYAETFYEDGAGVVDGTISNERYDLPQMVVDISNLVTGWTAAVDTKVEGKKIEQESVVQVEISMNGQEWSQQGVTFDYISLATVTEVSPTHGPLTGGTEVIVTGTNFVKSSLLMCQFGDSKEYLVKPIRYFNSSMIMCITPPSPYFRKPLVKVTSNGQLMNDDISTSSAIFVYDTPIKVKGFFPIAGPASGNFSVQVSGGPFNQTDELRCKFGHIAVQAFYIDEGLIDCYAPPHPPGWYPFEVTTNDQDYTTSRIPFFFYADPNLSRISPVSGPAVVAGTQVQVYGSGFINSTSLTCRFGWTNAPGVYVSSNYIVCPTPRLDEGLSGGMSWTALSEQFNRYRDPKYQNTVFRDTEDPTALFPGAYFYPLYLSRLVTVEVSNNNQDFTNSGINFLYQADAFVESVLPNVGQVNTRTAIVVKGDNFVNSTLLRCRIGEYVSTPTFLSRDLVLCFTPRIPLIAADHAYVNTRRTKNEFIPHERSSDTGPVDSPPNIVYVEVSNNGQDFTNNKLTFTFDVKCATGYYCPQQSQTACPPGTFCPGEFNKNFTLCPAGTYNPVFAQADNRAGNSTQSSSSSRPFSVRTIWSVPSWSRADPTEL